MLPTKQSVLPIPSQHAELIGRENAQRLSSGKLTHFGSIGVALTGPKKSHGKLPGTRLMSTNDRVHVEGIYGGLSHKLMRSATSAVARHMQVSAAP